MSLCLSIHIICLSLEECFTSFKCFGTAMANFFLSDVAKRFEGGVRSISVSFFKNGPIKLKLSGNSPKPTSLYQSLSLYLSLLFPSKSPLDFRTITNVRIAPINVSGDGGNMDV